MLRKLTPRLLLVICALLWGQSAIAITAQVTENIEYPCEEINDFIKADGYHWSYVNDHKNQYKCFSVVATVNFGNRASFDAFRENESNIEMEVSYKFLYQGGDFKIVDIIYETINPFGDPNGSKNYATDPEEANNSYGWRLSSNDKLTAFMRLNAILNYPFNNGTSIIGYLYGTLSYCENYYDPKWCFKKGYIVIQSYSPTIVDNPVKYSQYKRPDISSKSTIFNEPVDNFNFMPLSIYSFCLNNGFTICNNTLLFIFLKDVTSYVEVGTPLTTLQQAVYINPINSHN